MSLSHDYSLDPRVADLVLLAEERGALVGGSLTEDDVASLGLGVGEARELIPTMHRELRRRRYEPRTENGHLPAAEPLFVRPVAAADLYAAERNALRKLAAQPAVPVDGRFRIRGSGEIVPDRVVAILRGMQLVAVDEVALPRPRGGTQRHKAIVLTEAGHRLAGQLRQMERRT